MEGGKNRRNPMSFYSIVQQQENTSLLYTRWGKKSSFISPSSVQPEVASLTSSTSYWIHISSPNKKVMPCQTKCYPTERDTQSWVYLPSSPGESHIPFAALREKGIFLPHRMEYRKLKKDFLHSSN
jgi:hypothetical protein